ncbi:MAG: hypothetical protein KAI47_12400, partial [Deltaproteobacteria bacterium]|nr:hypothetical protein [Deltaproteobacteria bacterium]
IESASIRHQRVSFKDFRSRRHEIREAVKGKKLPEKPILFVAERPKEAFWLRELAAMAVAQDLGWPTFNGYSGYAPLGHVRATSCSALPGRLLAYLRWAQMVDLARYREMMKRVVLVGFHDCHQGWWKAMPSFTFGSRDLTRDEFRKIRLSVQALKREGKHKARLRVDVINGSGRLLHTHSRKGHHLRLSWRWIDVATNKSLGGFEQRVPLESDLKSGKTQPLDFLIEVPKGKKGKFLLEVSLVQEAVFWLHDLGVTLPRAELEE